MEFHKYDIELMIHWIGHDQLVYIHRWFFSEDNR